MKPYHLILIETVGVGICMGAFVSGLADMSNDYVVSSGTIGAAVIGLVIAVGACAAFWAKEPDAWMD